MSLEMKSLNAKISSFFEEIAPITNVVFWDSLPDQVGGKCFPRIKRGLDKIAKDDASNYDLDFNRGMIMLLNGLPDTRPEKKQLYDLVAQYTQQNPDSDARQKLESQIKAPMPAAKSAASTTSPVSGQFPSPSAATSVHRQPHATQPLAMADVLPKEKIEAKVNTRSFKNFKERISGRLSRAVDSVDRTLKSATKTAGSNLESAAQTVGNNLDKVAVKVGVKEPKSAPEQPAPAPLKPVANDNKPKKSKSAKKSKTVKNLTGKFKYVRKSARKKLSAAKAGIKGVVTSVAGKKLEVDVKTPAPTQISSVTSEMDMIIESFQNPKLSDADQLNAMREARKILNHASSADSQDKLVQLNLLKRILDVDQMGYGELAGYVMANKNSTDKETVKRLNPTPEKRAEVARKDLIGLVESIGSKTASAHPTVVNLLLQLSKTMKTPTTSSTLSEQNASTTTPSPSSPLTEAARLSPVAPDTRPRSGTDAVPMLSLADFPAKPSIKKSPVSTTVAGRERSQTKTEYSPLDNQQPVQNLPPVPSRAPPPSTRTGAASPPPTASSVSAEIQAAEDIINKFKQYAEQQRDRQTRTTTEGQRVTAIVSAPQLVAPYQRLSEIVNLDMYKNMSPSQKIEKVVEELNKFKELPEVRNRTFMVQQIKDCLGKIDEAMKPQQPHVTQERKSPG